MIKIQKPSAPQVIIDNQATWTKALLNAVASYGGYDKIPEAEKKSLLSHYKHKDIHLKERVLPIRQKPCLVTRISLL